MSQHESDETADATVTEPRRSLRIVRGEIKASSHPPPDDVDTKTLPMDTRAIIEHDLDLTTTTSCLGARNPSSNTIIRGMGMRALPLDAVNERRMKRFAVLQSPAGVRFWLYVRRETALGCLETFAFEFYFDPCNHRVAICNEGSEARWPPVLAPVVGREEGRQIPLQPGRPDTLTVGTWAVRRHSGQHLFNITVVARRGAQMVQHPDAGNNGEVRILPVDTLHDVENA